MAIVFLAEDLKHGRRVAIKVLKPELSAVLGSERFLREIGVVATLQHPHILPLYDSGEAAGFLYYVMPFAEGESLRDLLKREGKLPTAAALRIAHEIGSALQYAHERGVIHRDVKPENVLLSGGHAVVTDFGIARALDAAGGEPLTVTGMMVGTPQYMSPEQAGSTALDGRSDQYSLGCMLYEMLAGEPPYTASTPLAVLGRHAHDPVPDLSSTSTSIPPSLAQAIMRALAKSPTDRFDSVRAFVDALGDTGAATPAALPQSPERRPSHRRLAAALALVPLAIVALWWLLGRSPSSTGPRAVTAVAVLPFADSTSAPDSAYLAVGMTEGLIADLSQVGALKVLSRSSTADPAAASRSLADFARELGVNAVVRGRLRRAADSVMVSVTVVRAPDGTALFTQDYQRALGELPDLQREITTGITRSLRATLKRAERSRLDRRGAVDQRAYEAYLRGRFHLERDELEPARLQFEQAGRIAPRWAPPQVGLANYYTALPFSADVSPAEVLPKARSALSQALELDETLAEAHAANAYIRAYYEWDWRVAEQEFRRALELRPNYADAYFSYSRFLATRRRFDEAIAQLGRAVELDPLSLLLKANRALLDYFAGHYGAADSLLEVVLATDSTDVLALWGRALVAEQQGRYDEAIAILEPRVGRSLNRKASIGHMYARAGQDDRARGVLREMHEASARSYVSSYYFALVHAGLGERDDALRYLERSYDERSTILAYLLIDPRLAALRDDPRFETLARRIRGE